MDENMKKILLLVSFLMIAVSICGCNQNEIVFSDQYIFGQDSQFSLSTNFDPGITQSEDGYYFCSGPSLSYLYFYDNKTGLSVPLCNKPNCLHENETDVYKIADCDAFIYNAKYLKYYMNDLYFLSVEEDEKKEFRESIYKVSKDGTSHRRIYISKEMISNFQIHRGSIFFSASDAPILRGIGENNISTYKLFQFELNKLGASPVLIAEESGVNADIGDIICYGNNIYYETQHQQDTKTLYSVSKYNILTKDKKVIVEDCFPQFTIFNDKLIFIRNKQVYYSDLNGENPKKFSDTLGMFYSNSNYLFIDNMMYAAVMNLERTILVIDKSWKPVKTISLKGFQAGAYGCSDEFFFIPEVGKYNKYGEIVSLLCIPVNRTPDEMNLVSFHEFIPQVPYSGIKTKE